jgi:Phosphotransferase enzyme family
LAARHFGHFNGASLVADSLPDETWFSRGWLRQYVTTEGAAAARLTVADDAHALVRQCFPPAVVAWVRGLWAEREAFLTALDRLPQTVCHHDAFRRNLFARRCADGTEQTVAVDWAFMGIGAVGAELAPLVMGSLLLFEVVDAPPRDLVETALAGYLMGLREVGWRSDEGLIRLGFLATAALLYTVCSAGFMVALLDDPSRYPAFERSLGRPMAEAVTGWVELWPFQVELVEEARRLLPI